MLLIVRGRVSIAVGEEKKGKTHKEDGETMDNSLYPNTMMGLIGQKNQFYPYMIFDLCQMSPVHLDHAS